MKRNRRVALSRERATRRERPHARFRSAIASGATVHRSDHRQGQGVAGAQPRGSVFALLPRRRLDAGPARLLAGVGRLALLGEGLHALARVARAEDRTADLELPGERVGLAVALV